MKFMQTEKKQLLIYVIIAYGITYVMGLLMWYSYGKGLDLSAFPNAQMLYPAAGVMMAYLITKKGDKNLPTAFYIFFVALTAVLVVCTAASVLAPQNRDLMSMPYSQWAPIMEYVIIGGSVIFWILLLQSGKEKRRSYGLNSEHWNISIRMILLFIGLYLLRFVIACALSGQLSEFGKIMANPTTWIMVSICAKDSGGPYNYELVTELSNLAKSEGLDYAIDVYPHYGSDVEATLHSGYDIRHGLIGAGVYASHNYERSHMDGVENTYKLLKKYITK